MSNKVPQIRFNGYSDAWVQRNLGEVVQKVKSYSLSRDVETEDDTGFEYIHYGDIHTQKADVIDGNTKLPSIVPGDYDLIQEGDVIVADASEDYLGIAEPAVVVNKPTENLVAGLHTIAIRPNGIHPLFLYYLLHTQLFKHFGYRTGTGLKVFGISYPNLAKFTFAMPTLDEQKAIANTLRDMDNLIAANQRKLDLLKEQKKGYLQKMFPKNGAKVPELRFAGFADDWVQRKAKDLFIPVNERNREDLPVLSVTQDQGVVFRNDLAIDIKYDESTLSSYKVIHPGDFVISLRSFQGGFELSNVLGISSPAYTIFDFAVPAEQDKLYWKTIFKTFKFIESLKTVTFGIRDGKSISFKEFGDLKLNYPSDVDEQRRIGEFFAKLDETIAANQHKLDLLKKQKKGYLQKIFVWHVMSFFI